MGCLQSKIGLPEALGPGVANLSCPTNGTCDQFFVPYSV